eukprot:gene9118-11174_t
MQVIVPSRHIKQFAKSLQCMSKIGDDLYIEAKEEGVESAIGNQYKVKSKLCFSMFHAFNNIDKCAMKISNEEGKISFHLLCKNGIQKTYSLNFEISQCLTALYSKDTPHKLIVKPKQISDCLGYFAGTLEEVSIIVVKDRVKLRSYIDDGKKNNNKMLQTEVIIDCADFDEYLTNGSGADISFSFKDLKTIMSYCEAIGNPVAFYIADSGKPFHIYLKYNNTFEVDFVLATLLNNNNSTPSSQGSVQQQQQQQPDLMSSNNGIRSNNNSQNQQQQQQQQYHKQSSMRSSPGGGVGRDQHTGNSNFNLSPNTNFMNGLDMEFGGLTPRDDGPMDYDINSPSSMNNNNRNNNQPQQSTSQQQQQLQQTYNQNQQQQQSTSQQQQQLQQQHPSSNQNRSTITSKNTISYALRGRDLDVNDDEDEGSDKSDNETISSSLA